MKRTMLTALLALVLAGTTVQQASAWCKFSFGVGLNVSFECGGSCTKCCLWEHASYPPPPCYGFGYAPPAFAAPVPPTFPAPIHPVGYDTYAGYHVQPAYWWGN